MTLFDYARQVARECSAEALASVDLSRTQGLVLLALRESRGGLTALELEHVTHLTGSCVRPRLLELESRGLARRTTEKRRSMGARTPSQVWVAA